MSTIFERLGVSEGANAEEMAEFFATQGMCDECDSPSRGCRGCYAELLAALELRGALRAWEATECFCPWHNNATDEPGVCYYEGEARGLCSFDACPLLKGGA